MPLELVVIGNGLSGLSFIDSYLENNPKKKINVISPNNIKFKKNIDLMDDLLSERDVPPQMQKKKKEIKNFFYGNKIEIKNNLNILGTLEHGGLSNYWGCQLDKNFLDLKKVLDKKKLDQVEKSFYELLNKMNLLGVFNQNKYSYQNDFLIDKSLLELSQKKIKGIKFEKPLLAISKKKKYKKNFISLINSNYFKYNAKNFYNYFIDKNKIKFHNFLVEDIKVDKNKIIKIFGNDGKKKKIIYTKKIVFACGAIVTTKILMKYLNIKKTIRIKEHPRFISMFISRKKISNNFDFMPSQLQAYDTKSKSSCLIDFRPGNSFIIKTAVKIFKILKPFYFLLNKFKDHMIFSNILISSSFSNIYLKIKKNKTILFSKQDKKEKYFKYAHKLIFNLLLKKKIIYPFYKNFKTSNGSSYHYFGSIPIRKKKEGFYVNQNCQLLKNNNIYIVDGSIFDFKYNKYPLGIIMANARRIGKII